jgi:hypothetical protein
MALNDELVRIHGAVREEREERVAQLRAAVRRAEGRVADLNRQILAAGGGAADETERRAAASAVAEAAAPAERARREAQAAKALASRRKDEIGEWKAWYAGLAPDQQPEQSAVLAREVDWRAAELDALTARIPVLEAERLRRRGALELARAAAAAVENGLLPHHHPRVAELYRRLDDARAALEPALIALQAAETETPPDPPPTQPTATPVAS